MGNEDKRMFRVCELLLASLMKQERERLLRIFDLLLTALHRAGHLFAPARDGLTGYLPGLLQKHDFQQVRVRTVPISIDSSTQSDEAQQARGDLRYLLQTIPPSWHSGGPSPTALRHSTSRRCTTWRKRASARGRAWSQSGPRRLRRPPRRAIHRLGSTSHAGVSAPLSHPA